MTINNPEMFVASLWDWGFLEPCFRGTNIRPSDLDGVTEHNGHTLFIETKLPGVPVPMGQEIMFRAWQKDGNTVFIVWGHPNRAEAIQVYYPNGVIHSKLPCDNVALAGYVTRWFSYAKMNNKHVNRP